MRSLFAGKLQLLSLKADGRVNVSNIKNKGKPGGCQHANDSAGTSKENSQELNRYRDNITGEADDIRKCRQQLL